MRAPSRWLSCCGTCSTRSSGLLENLEQRIFEAIKRDYESPRTLLQTLPGTGPLAAVAAGGGTQQAPATEEPVAHLPLAGPEDPRHGIGRLADCA